MAFLAMANGSGQVSFGKIKDLSSYQRYISTFSFRKELIGR